MIVKEQEKIFLHLVRLGIGTSAEVSIAGNIEWKVVLALAEQQGLSAIVLDGIESNTNGMNTLPLATKLTWIGEVVQGYEQVYSQYTKAIVDLAAFYNSHGFRMMVLKGYACALNWPKPEHRPCGDIDIYLFGKYKEADETLSCELGIKVDHSHQHHTVFIWQGFTVENHYDFINVHHHRSNQELEKVLKQLDEDDTHYVEVDGGRVYLPSPNLNALFLLKHLMMHFAAEGITLRQVLDWGFFVKAHGKEVDWEWLSGVLERFGMKEMFYIFNVICVEDLGFDSQLFPVATHVDGAVKERVLSEILSPQFTNDMPQQLIPRVVWKTRRWHANSWKHKLCYKESMASAFWSGVKNHLLKPSSI